MLPHETIGRALLKTKGRRVTEFFGLPEADFRELTILAHHCEGQLGLKTAAFSALGPDSASGVRLELSGKHNSYQVRVSPLGGVSLDARPISGQMQQVFGNQTFGHAIGGQLFNLIKAQEKR